MRAFLAALFVIASLFSAQAHAEETLEYLPTGHVLVVLDERRIYFQPTEEDHVYIIPIAVGRPGMDRGILGTWKITRKEEWPTWTPTSAMMARNCKKYCRWANGMPGGKNNPLGARAMYLGASLYRLHGTNEPKSIGTAASSGCIRMHNDNAVWLSERVAVGTTVIVVRERADYSGEISVGGTFSDEGDAKITTLY